MKKSILALHVLISFITVADAANRTGFISIDCGAKRDYVDELTGIWYQTDEGFIESGSNHEIPPIFNISNNLAYMRGQLKTFRSFPEGQRNCYTLRPIKQKQKYLIRAAFAYQNYDSKNEFPKFDLYLGVNYWATIELNENKTFGYNEIIIQEVTNGMVQVCLVDMGEGKPFINTLELRPLRNSLYSSPFPLSLYTRRDCGPSSSINYVRSKDDVYDRLWHTYIKNSQWNVLETDGQVKVENSNYELPSEILVTACQAPNNSNLLSESWSLDVAEQFYLFLHFAEIQKLPSGQKRIINVTFNYENSLYEELTLEYLKPVTLNSNITTSNVIFTIRATDDSYAPPILNAFEIFKVFPQPNSPTDPQDDSSTNKYLKMEIPKRKNREFSHSQVLRITNNFKTLIGEGGFGKVYLGTLEDNSQVAVKLLSESSKQGYKEFQSEAQLLTVIHHRNLVSLVGYCHGNNIMALIYEYVDNGDLGQLLSEKNSNILGWKQRLEVAIDAAKGLEYLHTGCNTPIIHRDLKPSNILLNKSMVAKIADFGLSRVFTNEKDTHLSTQPAGTPGYIDPEFQRSGKLNKKTDIYSFGMILLQLITGRPPIKRGPEDISFIIDWIQPKIESADIEGIVDPRLAAEFSLNSTWKAVEVAMSCVLPPPTQRPTISYILRELQECLALEMGIHDIMPRNSCDYSGNILLHRYVFKEDEDLSIAIGKGSKKGDGDLKTDMSLRRSILNFASFHHHYRRKRIVDMGPLVLANPTKSEQNYDSKNQFPKFDVYLGVDFWTTIELGAKNFAYVEVTIEEVTNDWYKDDTYDRLWRIYDDSDWDVLKTPLPSDQKRIISVTFDDDDDDENSLSQELTPE
ncbi:putative leucine-rich repeat receptor-like serine/threonine-protein kinase At2g19230 [Neltuma alba]|uniref:putative leucine-rich repeat receptor-like serine/threonine-protein kinase At2g19230 n=1 Tax=Neltuma alba TaxID=207710 RepID=UPI0010A304B9|nr:putative leucine-rich repeat receptor-like serine/threonine-protein kinase At2g19230 [Prosopis alba]